MLTPQSRDFWQNVLRLVERKEYIKFKAQSQDIIKREHLKTRNAELRSKLFGALELDLDLEDAKRLSHLDGMIAIKESLLRKTKEAINRIQMEKSKHLQRIPKTASKFEFQEIDIKIPNDDLEIEDDIMIKATKLHVNTMIKTQEMINETVILRDEAITALSKLANDKQYWLLNRTVVRNHATGAMIEYCTKQSNNQYKTQSIFDLELEYSNNNQDIVNFG